jgi:hypothetical protein
MKIKPDCTIYNTIWHDISLRAIFSDNSSVVRLLGVPAGLIPAEIKEIKSVLVDDVDLISRKSMQYCHSSFVEFTHWNTNNSSKYVLEAGC